MEKYKEWNALAGQLNVDNVVGHFKGIYFEFRGTAQAVQNAAISDITEIRIDWAKRKGAVVMPMQRLAQVAAFKGGRIGDRANTGGAFYFGAYYSCGMWGDDNAYIMTPKDNFNIQVKFGANVTSTVYASAVFSIFLDYGEGLMKYFVNMDAQTLGSIVANSITQPFTFEKENIASVFVTPNTNITAIQATRGKRTFDMTFEGWRNTSYYKNNIKDNAQETSPTFTLNKPDMAEIQFFGHGSYSEIMEDNCKLNFAVGTAPTPDLIFVHLDFTPDKLDESATAIKANLDGRTATKQTIGSVRPIQVARKLAVGALAA